MTDRKGEIYRERDDLNWIKEEMAGLTNHNMQKGTLADVIKGADVFIGVYEPNTHSIEMVRSMNKDAIVLLARIRLLKFFLKMPRKE